MLKTVAIIWAILLVLPAAAAAEDLLVRGVPWGAPSEQVKISEKAPLKRETTNGAQRYLIYTDTYLNEPITLIYKFVHDRLFEVSTVFESRGRKCPELTVKFNEALTDLTAKHGPPLTSRGEGCNAYREWQMGPSQVALDISTDSGRTDLAATITNKEFAKLAQEVTTVVRSREVPPAAVQ